MKGKWVTLEVRLGDRGWGGHGWGRAQPSGPWRRPCLAEKKEKGVTWGPEREGPGGAACSQEERELG